MRAISSQHLLEHGRSKTLTDAAAFFCLCPMAPGATASENSLAIMPTFGAQRFDATGFLTEGISPSIDTGTLNPVLFRLRDVPSRPERPWRDRPPRSYPPSPDGWRLSTGCTATRCDDN